MNLSMMLRIEISTIVLIGLSVVLKSLVDGFVVSHAGYFREATLNQRLSTVSQNHFIFQSGKSVYIRHMAKSSKSTEEESEEDDDDDEEEFFEESAAFNYEDGEDDEVDGDQENQYTDEPEEFYNEEIVELQDDETDINYSVQKKLLEETIERRNVVNKFLDYSSGESSPRFIKENIGKFLDEQMEQAGINQSDVDQYMQNFAFDENDVKEPLEALNAFNAKAQKTEKASSMLQEFVSSPVSVDDFPPEDDPIYESTGLNPKDLVRLQNALEGLLGTIKGYQDGSLIDNKQAIIRPQYELDQLDRLTLDEINLCLNASAVDQSAVEYDETVKNGDPIRWLLYDLDFNVTNLMLASCKHNPEAPLILNHWMPQLCAYSRYADVREREFQFSWEDCEKSDMNELKRYFNGLGYAEIPTFSPKETNIVNLETEYDQEDITMSAFENWMDEVYSDEDEDLYFDDELFQPENNVFDFQYGMEDSEDLITFKSELEEFENEHHNETEAFRKKFVRKTTYTYDTNSESSTEFRGHLVVACCGSDRDLELAEKITSRMADEFGEQVYVETRVYAHARQEDNLYEIWLESYDIELLHSRRGAFYNSKQWKGPADVDASQMDTIVKRVGYLISDEARYSHRLHEFASEV